MTNRLLNIVFLNLLVITAFGQDITRQEADSMVNALDKKSRPDLKKMDLLLNLAQFHIFKPGEFQVDFDSAMFYIDEAKSLNKVLKSPDAHGYLLLTESFLMREKGQRDEAKKMTENAITILESGSNKSYLGHACYELAWFYDYSVYPELLKKTQLIEQSVEFFQQGGNIVKKARAMEMLGDLYAINNQPSKAISILQQALAAYDTLKHQQLQGVYVILGGAYIDELDYEQGLFYLLKALKTAQVVGDTSMQLCNINNLLAILYDEIDGHEMSVKYEEDALQIARKYNDAYAVFFLSVNLATGYDRLGQPERGLEVLASIPDSYIASINARDKSFITTEYLRIYLSLKQYDKAQPLIDPLLKWAEDSTITKHGRIIHRLIATYYFDTHQFAKARACLMKNRNTMVEKQYALWSTIVDSRLWYKLDSARGDFHSAFNHLLFYKTKMDSILSINRMRQLQVLGVEYETTLKEDSIKLKDKNILLLKQQNGLQQARLEQANLTKNVTVGGIILASIIIGLLYRLYRQKQKSNQVITYKNEQLQHFLTEKEWLLKEIHHRVKNNLQIVMSLLNSQSAYIDNEPALTAIHDSQHRVHAISLIHQKLYNLENVSSLDISFYIRELVSYLSDSFNIGQRIRFELNVDKLEMDVGQAVPLGLILNEAITNAIKYAFPNGRDGMISISLTTTVPNHFVLNISDNGIGLPHNFNSKRPGSLGMSLITGLSEDLEGSFSIENNNGTTLKISFVHIPGIKRTDNIVESIA